MEVRHLFFSLHLTSISSASRQMSSTVKPPASVPASAPAMQHPPCEMYLASPPGVKSPLREVLDSRRCCVVRQLQWTQRSSQMATVVPPDASCCHPKIKLLGYQVRRRRYFLKSDAEPTALRSNEDRHRCQEGVACDKVNQPIRTRHRPPLHHFRGNWKVLPTRAATTP